MAENEIFIGVKDAAKILDISEGSVYGMVARLELPSYQRKRYGKIRFLRSELINFIKEDNRAERLRANRQEQLDSYYLKQMSY